MPNGRKFLAGLFSSAITLIFLGYSLSGSSVAPLKTTKNSTPNLLEHSIYSDYAYGDTTNIIDIGTQPLWLPGVIAEVMKRDTVLESELAKHAMAIRFHSYLKGADSNFFLNRGDLEGAIGGDMPALLACAKSKTVVTSLIDQSFVSIITKRWMMTSELRGKKIGYGFGSNSHHVLLKTLAGDNLTQEDVELIPLDLSQMPAALNSGKIDAFVAFEPTPSIAQSIYPEFVTIGRGLAMGYLYFAHKTHKQNPDAVKQIIAAQLRAMKWLTHSNNNLVAAIQWTLESGEKIGGTNRKDHIKPFTSAVKNGLLGISSSATLPKRDLQANGKMFHEFQFLQQIALIDKTVDWKSIAACFDRNFISTIYSQPKKYHLDDLNTIN